MSFDSHTEYEHIIPTLLVVFVGTALLVLLDAAERRGKWVSSLCFQFEPFCMHYTCSTHCQVMCNTWLLGVHLQGVLEAVRISCAGYRTRRTFYEFLDRFGLLAPEVLEGK